MRALIDIIRDIEQERVQSRTYPTHVTLGVLRKKVDEEMRKELNEMVEGGLITHGKTLNDKFVKTIK